jgi:hypothetical protein
MAEMEPQRVAVFVDMENVPAAFIEAAADLGDTCGRVCHLAVYADWRQPANRAAWATTLDLGGVPKQIMKAGGANSADISIVVDAMELLLLAPQIDVFVLASGDSDFVPLVQRLRARGKLVVGAAPVGRAVRSEFESAFDRFERMREPVDDAQAEKKPKPAPATPKTAPAPLTLAATRKALISILSREGTMDSGELGSSLRDVVPGFDQRKLGYRRLSDLLRAQTDLLSVESEGVKLRVKLLPSALLGSIGSVMRSQGSPNGGAAPKAAAAAPVVTVPSLRTEPPAPVETHAVAEVAVREEPPPRPPPSAPSIDRGEWTRLRDHLLAVMLAPDAPSHRSDEDLRAAMSELAKRSGGTDLANAPISEIVTRYPSCFQRGADATLAPAIGLADAYKLRLSRLWEPVDRNVLRHALARLPSVVSEEPVVFANIATRLAEVANGELTQADARTIINLLRKTDGFASAPLAEDRKPRVQARSWVLSPLVAEARLDEEALARMGPFLPVDPAAMAAALGIDTESDGAHIAEDGTSRDIEPVPAELSTT